MIVSDSTVYCKFMLEVPMPTKVAPVKFLPFIVTLVPVGPDIGLNELITGSGINVNVSELTTVPPGVVILTVPVAPVPTLAPS